MRDDIEILSEYENMQSTILCKCKNHPHNIFSVKAYTLSSGGGVCNICALGKKKLVGRTFGKLLVTGLDEELSVKKKKAYWKCECSCGNKISVLQSSLLDGNTQSCGCLNNERIKEIGYKNKIYNKYDLTGEYGIGYMSNGKCFYFDLDDYEIIKDYCWHSDNYGAIKACELRNRGYSVYMHRLIFGLRKNIDYSIQVDHINHNRADNRKENLRLVDNSHNQMNTKIGKNNLSGEKGVSFQKASQKYMARITVNKKVIYLGLFEDIKDAKNARKEAEKEYFGEYAYDERGDMR